VRPLLVVEGEELVKSSEPPAVFVVGLEEPLDLLVRLWPSNLAEGVRNLVFGEVAFELVVQTGPLVLVRVDELRAMVGDHLQDRDRSLPLLSDAIK